MLVSLYASRPVHGVVWPVIGEFFCTTPIGCSFLSCLTTPHLRRFWHQSTKGAVHHTGFGAVSSINFSIFLGIKHNAVNNPNLIIIIQKPKYSTKRKGNKGKHTNTNKFTIFLLEIFNFKLINKPIQKIKKLNRIHKR